MASKVSDLTAEHEKRMQENEMQQSKALTESQDEHRSSCQRLEEALSEKCVLEVQLAKKIEEGAEVKDQEASTAEKITALEKEL